MKYDFTLTTEHKQRLDLLRDNPGVRMLKLLQDVEQIAKSPVLRASLNKRLAIEFFTGQSEAELGYIITSICSKWVKNAFVALGLDPATFEPKYEVPEHVQTLMPSELCDMDRNFLVSAPATVCTESAASIAKTLADYILITNPDQLFNATSQFIKPWINAARDYLFSDAPASPEQALDAESTPDSFPA